MAYLCPYINRQGKKCGKGARRPEGCGAHVYSRPLAPCGKCQKPTNTITGLCARCGKSAYTVKYIRERRAGRLTKAEEARRADEYVVELLRELAI